MHVNLCTECMHDAHRVQKRMLDPPETQVIDGYVPPSRCRESNLGPLEEEPAQLNLCVCGVHLSAVPQCLLFLRLWSQSTAMLTGWTCDETSLYLFLLHSVFQLSAGLLHLQKSQKVTPLNLIPSLLPERLWNEAKLLSHSQAKSAIQEAHTPVQMSSGK